MVNVMSSPGRGKTTTLVSTVKALKEEMNIGVIEADVDSDVDAKPSRRQVPEPCRCTQTVCATLTPPWQELGGCSGSFGSGSGVSGKHRKPHLSCGLRYGAMKNIAILSVPEGDDKPLKYPMIFAKVDALLISKMDVMPHFDFDMEALKERVYHLNQDIETSPSLAKTGEGMDAWTNLA